MSQANKGQGPQFVFGHIVAAAAIVLFLGLMFRAIGIFALFAFLVWANEKGMDCFERYGDRKPKDRESGRRDEW